MRGLALISLFLGSCFVCEAREVLYLGRSPKGNLMGNAYTSYGTDEYSLFYNPALLGRNDGVQFTPLNPSIGVTNVLDDLDRFDNFPSSDPVAITERVIGLPIYVQTGIYPGFKMGPFGFSLFANQQTSMILRNQTHPTLSLDYRLDRGFIFGGAFSIGEGAKASVWDGRQPKRKRKNSSGHRWSYGFAVKNVNRQGLSGDFDLFGTDLVSIINSGSSSYSDIRNELGFAKGEAWGLDLGVDFIYASDMFEFGSSLAILDVGDTRFAKTQGEGDVPIQQMAITWGNHVLFDFGIGELALSMDIGPMNQGLAAGRWFHLGAEVSLPIISAFAGYNEGYLGYGLEIDIWVARVIAGFYSVEVSGDYKIEEGKRAVIYLSLIDVSM